MTTQEKIHTEREQSFEAPGVEYNDFKMRDKLKKGAMYLGLFHGRNTKDEELNDWGFDGPVIGPLKWVHTTYRNHIRFCMLDELDSNDGNDLEFSDDLLMWEGKFYGDFTVFIN